AGSRQRPEHGCGPPLLQRGNTLAGRARGLRRVAGGDVWAGDETVEGWQLSADQCPRLAGERVVLALPALRVDAVHTFRGCLRLPTAAVPPLGRRDVVGPGEPSPWPQEGPTDAPDPVGRLPPVRTRTTGREAKEGAAALGVLGGGGEAIADGNEQTGVG